MATRASLFIKLMALMAIASLLVTSLSDPTTSSVPAESLIKGLHPLAQVAR